MNVAIIFFTLIAAAANVAGGFIILFKKQWSNRNLNALMALSAGLLVTIAIMDLIPEALTVDSSSALYILIGFITIFFFQQFVASHFHFGEETHEHKITHSTVLGAFFGLLIHTFFDGFAIVISFEVEFRLGIVVLVAVLLHKIPDGITISSIVYTLLRNRRIAIMAAVFLGLSTMIGALVASMLVSFPLPFDKISASALAFSAGVFLYVACTDLLPVVNSADDRPVAAVFFLGVLFYFISHLLIPHAH